MRDDFLHLPSSATVGEVLEAYVERQANYWWLLITETKQVNKSAFLLTLSLIAFFIAGCGKAEPTPPPTVLPMSILPNMLGLVLGPPGSPILVFGSANENMISDVFNLDYECTSARVEWHYIPNLNSFSFQFELKDGEYQHHSHWTGSHNPEKVGYEDISINRPIYLKVDSTNVDWELRLTCLEYEIEQDITQ